MPLLALTARWLVTGAGSVDDLIHEHKDLLACETVSDQALDPKALGFINTPVAAGSWQHQSALRSGTLATTA